MKRADSVPLLPGYTSTQPLPHKGRKGKPQNLVYMHNAAYDKPLADKGVPVLDSTQLTDLMSTMKNKTATGPGSNSMSKLITMSAAERQAERRKEAVPSMGPSWLKHDKQVCRFYAYTQECVTESNSENARYRYCTILYYLEDGTMELAEQKIENAGMHQGKMVRRHVVVKDDGSFMSLDDMRCGINVEIYGRSFRIVGCDSFTRWYYGQNGIDVGEEEGAPTDSFLQTQRFNKRKQMMEIVAPRQIKEGQKYNEKAIGGNPDGNKKLEQFMRNDLRVLMFYAYWEDETSYGNRTYYELSYFMAENAMQITEVPFRNCGKAKHPSGFWKKSPLPKNPGMNIYPGMLQADADIYMPQDLKTGETISVYGRKLRLYDCDPFTREFYLHWNNTDQDRIILDGEGQYPEEEKYEFPKLISPHIGLGGPEDSLATCYALWPKAPKENITKAMVNSGKILRYEGMFEELKYDEDAERRFIISFNLGNDYIGVYEMRRRNSGFMEGKFADNKKRQNPFTGEYFKESDFFTGARIRVCSATFKIVRPDEYTLAHMEAHSEFWPYSDVTAVTAKVLGMADKLAGKENATPEELLECGLVDQEVITLLRAYGTPGQVGIPLAALGA